MTTLKISSRSIMTKPEMIKYILTKMGKLTWWEIGSFSGINSKETKEILKELECEKIIESKEQIIPKSNKRNLPKEDLMLYEINGIS